MTTNDRQTRDTVEADLRVTVTETTTWEDTAHIRARLWLSPCDTTSEVEPYIECAVFADTADECILRTELSVALIDYVVDNTGGNEQEEDARALMRRIFHHFDQELLAYFYNINNQNREKDHGPNKND